jgi:hypothetical protein
MHIHPVVEGLGTGTVLRKDKRDIHALLVLDSHIPVLPGAMISDFVWTGGCIRLGVGEHELSSSHVRKDLTCDEFVDEVSDRAE